MNIFVRLFVDIFPHLSSRAFAADNRTVIGVQIPGSNKTSYPMTGGWGEYLSDFYSYAQYVGISLAILMILYSAVLYVTSEGDSSKLGTAKEITIGALVGLAMLFMINFLARVIGIEGIAT